MSEENRGQSVRRVLKMLVAMMKGKRLDSQYCAETCGTTPEVALRDLKLLQSEVPGVFSEKVRAKHVFRFDLERSGIKSPIKEERTTIARVISATLGAAFSKVFTGTTYQVELEAIRKEAVKRFATIRKQQLLSMNRKFVVLCSHETSLADRSGDLDDILDAILREKLLDFRYQTFEGKEDQRTIKPYSLVVHDAQLYVLGVELNSDTSEEPKTFRFARMRSIGVRNESFDYPEPNEYDPAVLFRNSVGIWLGGVEPCKVKVRLDPHWATYALHHRWHGSQVTRQLEDGSVEIELFVRPCPELEQWLLRFGENARVIEPATLRDRIHQRLLRAAGQYDLSVPRPSGVEAVSTTAQGDCAPEVA